MSKIEPIIAVKDLNISVAWFESIFGWKRTHGGQDFAVLEDDNEEIVICLHKWGEHQHPTMMSPKITRGNGLILYYKTNDIETIRQKLREMNHPVDEDIHLNPNSGKMEFSLRDRDEYYWTVTEYHKYEG